MPIRPYRRDPRRIRRSSQGNPEGRALFGARFVDVLDRGSATLFARLLPIIRKGLRRRPTPAVKQALRRDLLLTLASASFFRLRWSPIVLDEVERAIRRIKAGDDEESAAEQAFRARGAMERAFPEASIDDFDAFLPARTHLPDQDDAHIVAAAMKTQAAVIVTENLKHFPGEVIGSLNMEVRSSDVFLADTIALEPGRDVKAVRMMRERYARPEMTARHLLARMESRGLFETADVLRPHCGSL